MANHTSPIDIVILCNDGCYAMVCEKSNRFPRLLHAVSSHFWSSHFGLSTLLFPGGSGPWRSDGDCSESHGEVLPSCMV